MQSERYFAFITALKRSSLMITLFHMQSNSWGTHTLHLGIYLLFFHNSAEIWNHSGEINSRWSWRWKSSMFFSSSLLLDSRSCFSDYTQWLIRLRELTFCTDLSRRISNITFCWTSQFEKGTVGAERQRQCWGTFSDKWIWWGMSSFSFFEKQSLHHSNFPLTFTFCASSLHHPQKCEWATGRPKHTSY